MFLLYSISIKITLMRKLVGELKRSNQYYRKATVGMISIKAVKAVERN